MSDAALDVRSQDVPLQLVVFAAGFDRRAAEQILQLPDSASSLDDLLDQLYSSSLLDYASQTDHFSLHDLVRVFTLEQLRKLSIIDQEEMRQEIEWYEQSLKD